MRAALHVLRFKRIVVGMAPTELRGAGNISNSPLDHQTVEPRA